MEKKAPEKKVLLREKDVFYVYNKRINKCVKEDCEGIVKYGLILKVNMQNGDTLNTYECNKCHMKYTAYPNYVRLTSADGLVIYNKDEVEARDRKRAEDARKQAAREKKKAFARQRTFGKNDKKANNLKQKKQKQGKFSYGGHDKDNRYRRSESGDYRTKNSRYKDYSNHNGYSNGYHKKYSHNSNNPSPMQ